MLLNTLRIAAAMIGTIIGAGFASGREVWQFFSVFGVSGTAGLLLFMGLFFTCNVLLMNVSYRNKTANYYQVIEQLIGRRGAKVFDLWILLYLFSGTAVMMAGSGATVQEFGLPFTWGVVFLAVMVAIVLLHQIKGLLSVNMVLMPVLLGILIYISLTYIIHHPDPVTSASAKSGGRMNPYPASIAYTASNMIALFGVMSALAQSIHRKSEVWFGSLLGAVGLGVTALLIHLSLLRLSPEVMIEAEMPLYALVRGMNPWLESFVAVCIWLAIFTTAVSGVFTLTTRLQSQWRLPPTLLSTVLVISMIPVSYLGFATLVKILYPLYGIVNSFLLVALLLHQAKRLQGGVMK